MFSLALIGRCPNALQRAEKNITGVKGFVLRKIHLQSCRRFAVWKELQVLDRRSGFALS